MISELQAEPWEPGKLVYKEEADPVSCSPRVTKENVDLMKELGAEIILLWGAEYWVFRERTYGDDSWIEMIRKIDGSRETYTSL